MGSKTRRYLDMRGNKYWFKRDIPEAIRSCFGGKRTYLVNLETGDIKTAMRRRDDLARETDKAFRDARDGGLPDTALDVVRSLAEGWLREIESAKRDPVAWTARVTATSEEEIEETDTLSPHMLLEDTVETIARQHGEAAGKRFLNIVHGRVAIDYHVEAYLKEAKLAPKTTNEKRSLIGLFAKWATAEGLTLGEINRSVAGRYVTTVISPMHPVTAKKHLGSVKLYWDYLIRRGHLGGKNPWEGQAMPSRTRRVERNQDSDERPFTEAEMKKLLYSSYPARMRTEFGPQLHDAMRISALSGMRQAEVITMWVEECEFDDQGRGTFNIRQGKTRAAARRVPIHPDLLDIVRRRMAGKGPQDWLFDELAREKSPADIFGKRFAAYREKLGVDDKQDGRRRSLVNFHSFRRWFITEAERAGQPESIISEVVGHEEGRKSITLRVYSAGPSGEQKRACVEAVSLPHHVPKRA